MAACGMAMPLVSVWILAHFIPSMATAGAEDHAEGTRKARPTLSLLQTGATLVRPRKVGLRRSADTTHATSSLETLGKSTVVSFEGIDAEANALRADVDQFHHGLQESFAKLQEKCKQDMLEQRNANIDIAQSNAYSAETLKSLVRDIRRLQRSAEQVQNNVTAVETQLHRLSGNITAGRDFLDQALAESNKRMKYGQELKALAELDKRVNAATSARDKKQTAHRLTRKHGAHRPRASLLQVPTGEHDDQDILLGLVARLVTLNEQGEEEHQNLLTLCQTGIEKGQAQHTALRKEQALIKERLELRSDLKRRLHGAEQHLKANLKQVEQRHRSLAIFTKVIGDRAMSSEKENGGRVSLLQIAPETSVSSRVSELQARLASMEMENRRKQATLRAKYASSLKSKQQESLAVAEGNVHTIQEIQQLHSSNAELRNRVESEAQGMEEWDSDWKSLNGNLSAALTVSKSALASLGGISGAPELRILHELDEKDATHGMLESAKHRFDDILTEPRLQRVLGEPRLQLLQLSRGTPRALLQALDSGIEDLEAQEDRVERQLGEEFNKAMMTEEGRLKKLMEERDVLLGRRQQEQSLQSRLLDALDHYSAADGELTEKAKAIRAYAAQLGGRALPVLATNATPVPTLVAEGTIKPASLQLAQVHDEIDSKEDPMEDLFNTDIDFDELPPKLEPTASVAAQEEAKPPASALALAQTSSSTSDDNKRWLSWFTR